MAAEDVAERPIGAEAEDTRTLHLSAYVELPLADVWDRFADPMIDDLLLESMQAALGGGEGISAHVSRPVLESDFNGHVAVSWRGPGERATEGVATISLLVVQSGHDPITELHVALGVPVRQADSIARNTHRFLDELTRRLEAVAR